MSEWSEKWHIWKWFPYNQYIQLYFCSLFSFQEFFLKAKNNWSGLNFLRVWSPIWIWKLECFGTFRYKNEKCLCCVNSFKDLKKGIWKFKTGIVICCNYYCISKVWSNLWCQTFPRTCTGLLQMNFHFVFLILRKRVDRLHHWVGSFKHTI